MQYIYCYYHKRRDPDPRLHDETCYLVDPGKANFETKNTKWSQFFPDRQSAEQDMRATNLEPIPCGKCIDRPSSRRP